MYTVPTDAKRTFFCHPSSEWGPMDPCGISAGSSFWPRGHKQNVNRALLFLRGHPVEILFIKSLKTEVIRHPNKYKVFYGMILMNILTQ